MTPSTHHDVPPQRNLGEARKAQRRALLIQEMLREAPSTSRGHRRWNASRTYRVVLAAGGLSTALAAATLIYIQGNHEKPGLALTPVMLTYHMQSDQTPASQVLQNLARTADSRADSPSNKYQYTKIQSWSLYTSVAQGATDSALVPATSETWRAADGSGISRTTSSTGSVVSNPLPVDSVRYSDDPKVLAQQLTVGHPSSQGPAERITAIVDLKLSHRVDPRLEGAVLRVLAGENGLVSQGEVTDRAGRQGLAFGVDSSLGGLPTRYSLIFDPKTGALLDYEEILTTKAGKLNVSIPSVIRYNVWAQQTEVPSPGVQPS